MYAAASAEDAGAGSQQGDAGAQGGATGSAQDDDVIDAEVVEDDETQDKK